MPKTKRKAKGLQGGGGEAKPKLSTFHSSPLYDLLHYFEMAQDQWAARYVIIMSALLVRAAVGLGNYSGYNTPPMFGDFEAQRHWMELTIHLPISKWYYFNLNYWGLDYPPLTAFHSYILGIIGDFINPSLFALDTSNGIENNQIKTFMRYLSIISELILYIPSILSITNLLGKKFKLNRMDQIIIACIILYQPHLILIDHGHFQYNSVMLGFFVYSLIELLKGRLILASIWFVCCINFKQMGLYYSTFIFTFILSQLTSFSHLILIGFTVALTQFSIIIPFIKNPSSLLQILIRVFPFNRGLFEDKVANFWGTTNVLLKYKEIIDAKNLSRLSLITTLLAILPVNIVLFTKFKKFGNKSSTMVTKALIYGFINNSLAFYLFSFQVHEKSILIPLVPSTLIILIDPELIDIVQWINNVGTFSLYPLLKKDGLILQYFVCTFLINWLIGYKLVFRNRNPIWNLIIKGTYLVIFAYHIIDCTFDPPKAYPDLWVILNCAISFGPFMLFWLWTCLQAFLI